MSSTNAEDAQKQEHVEDTSKDQVNEDSPENNPMHEHGIEEHPMPSPQQEVLTEYLFICISGKSYFPSQFRAYLA